jgi:phosphoserine/homoserine phosphotransferase
LKNFNLGEQMIIACLDLEGVLLPEIWINVAEKTNISELRLTTRDIKNYDELMQHRLKILKDKNIKYNDIKDVINTLSPLPGAYDFLKRLKEKFQVIILSDTFYQFGMPLMKKLDFPTLFCHDLIINDDDYIINYKLRLKELKMNSVLKLKELNFNVIACGDSYNDVTMFSKADKGILFKPPQNVIDEFPQYPVTMDYEALWKEFIKAEEEINNIL